EQLAYLPKLTLPAGVRVFLRALFDQEWNENVVVAAVSKPRWPVGPEAAAGSPDRPVTVMPRADMRNPLMWPLIAVQGASVAGWSDAEERVRRAAGPGVRVAPARAPPPAGGGGRAQGQDPAPWPRGPGGPC